MSLVTPVQEPDLLAAKAVGNDVRFFEQAFEWDKIGYVLYPYFWSRMDRWGELARLADDDPLFERFLKAGSARVLIPVRPGFERAFLYYLIWDEPWMGGDLPDFGDPMYLPITDEIRAQSGAAGDEVPVGEPWEIRVPTQLVKLREDDTLPKWEWLGHEDEVEKLRAGNWAWKGDQDP